MSEGDRDPASYYHAGVVGCLAILVAVLAAVAGLVYWLLTARP